jgi:uncharacterized protein YbbK (DUF523 family)
LVKVLISACLLGERVRYNGADARCADPILARWEDEGRLVPFCPEVAGGLGVPRPAAEIVGGSGADVLDGASRIITGDGRDVTAAFLEGARQAVGRALDEGVRLAVLKEGSPSCGVGRIRDGSFTGAPRSGEGLTAASLTRRGIAVFSEEQLEEAAAYVDTLESPGGHSSGL